MNLIDKALSTVGLQRKTPDFAVTNFPSRNFITSLVEPEQNYFDQYILYNYKAIDYISDKVASVELQMFEGDDKQDDNPILQNLLGFNPYMNLWEARKLKEIHLRLVGSAYWYIDREPEVNKMFELYPLRPDKMKVMTNNIGLPAYYQYEDGDGKLVDFRPEDVVYFRRVNPKNWFEGLSQTKQISYLTNAYAAGAQLNQNTFLNGGAQNLMLYFDGISDEDRERVEVQLQQKYGGPKNAGRRGVVNAKPEVIDLSKSQRDLQYVDGMKMLRQDILAAYGIPEALLFPSATNANSKEARYSFQADTIQPAIEQELAALNEQLLRKVQGKNAIATLEFRSEPVVQNDPNDLFEQAKKAVEAGIFTREQALEHIGLEDDGLGDLDEQGQEAPAPDPETEKRFKALQDALNQLIEGKYEEADYVKFEKMADSQEGILYKASLDLFAGQAVRSVQAIQKADKVTVRGVFDYDQEIGVTKNTFRQPFFDVLSNSNEAANTEIKSKLFRYSVNSAPTYKSKSLSGAAEAALTKKLEYFAGEITETTAKRLRKQVSAGIKEGFQKRQLAESVLALFNNQLDGTENAEFLQKIGVYEGHLSLVDSEIKMNTDARFRRMLQNLDAAKARGDIDSDQHKKGLQAIRGLIDPTSPIGTEIDQLLTTVYRVNKEEGITRSRAVTIARTEATYARNLGFQDTYEANPFVKGKRWSSARDKDTRREPDGGHFAAHGQVVAVDEPFTVGGEELMFPGDTSLGASAKNIVNCRCRQTAVVI